MISTGYIGITCCDEFRPPFAMFPLCSLELVKLLVAHLNSIDPKATRLHK